MSFTSPSMSRCLAAYLFLSGLSLVSHAGNLKELSALQSQTTTRFSESSPCSKGRRGEIWVQAMNGLKRWVFSSENLDLISEEEQVVVLQILSSLRDNPFSERFAEELQHTLESLAKTNSGPAWRETLLHFLVLPEALFPSEALTSQVLGTKDIWKEIAGFVGDHEVYRNRQVSNLWFSFGQDWVDQYPDPEPDLLPGFTKAKAQDYAAVIWLIRLISAVYKNEEPYKTSDLYSEIVSKFVTPGSLPEALIENLLKYRMSMWPQPFELNERSYVYGQTIVPSIPTLQMLADSKNPYAMEIVVWLGLEFDKKLPRYQTFLEILSDARNKGEKGYKKTSVLPNFIPEAAVQHRWLNTLSSLKENTLIEERKALYDRVLSMPLDNVYRIQQVMQKMADDREYDKALRYIEKSRNRLKEELPRYQKGYGSVIQSSILLLDAEKILKDKNGFGFTEKWVGNVELNLSQIEAYERDFGYIISRIKQALLEAYLGSKHPPNKNINELLSTLLEEYHPPKIVTTVTRFQLSQRFSNRVALAQMYIDLKLMDKAYELCSAISSEDFKDGMNELARDRSLFKSAILSFYLTNLGSRLTPILDHLIQKVSIAETADIILTLFRHGHSNEAKPWIKKLCMSECNMFGGGLDKMRKVAKAIYSSGDMDSFMTLYRAVIRSFQGRKLDILAANMFSAQEKWDEAYNACEAYFRQPEMSPVLQDHELRILILSHRSNLEELRIAVREKEQFVESKKRNELEDIQKAAQIYEEDGRYSEAMSLRQRASQHSLSTEVDHESLRRLEDLMTEEGKSLDSGSER